MDHVVKQHYCQRHDVTFQSICICCINDIWFNGFNVELDHHVIKELLADNHWDDTYSYISSL